VIALATCAELPELDEDGPALLDALKERGIDGVPAAWDDPEFAWADCDLTVIRSTWDYTGRREAFLQWADSLPRVLNQPSILRWNTDKRYLQDLSAAGLATVPTSFLEPGRAFEAPAGEYVVKPSVSAGSRDTARFAPCEGARAAELVLRIHAEGRTAMVQPYLGAVDEAGETALLYFGGRYSHAIRKGPLLGSGEAALDETGLFVPEDISPREPQAAELALADAVLDGVPADRSRLLYARVDLVPGPDGEPVLLELELTEPSLFLAHGTGAAERFAAAIEDALQER